MNQKSLKVNALWNFAYTGTNILFPIITAPYVSRILGASNLGKVDFAKSFVQWFILFASFGIVTYGTRSISQIRNNPKKLNKLFSELFLINFSFSIVAFLIFMIILLGSSSLKDEYPLFIVMSFNIVFNAVNIDWFYQGIEEYNYITLRNFIFKIISLGSIFLFIKSSGDYIVYGLISVFGVGFSGILNVLHSRKYVKFSFKNAEMKNHLRPMSTFFFITFVVNIYTNLDRTLLGFLSPSSSVAFLTMAKSVTSMGGTVANSMAYVAMPRASYYIKTDFLSYKKLMKTVPKYMLILTIPMACGIFLLSPEIMYILGGKEFFEASYLLSLISIVVILASLSGFLQNQVLIPNGNERFGLIASIISSIVSVVLNVLLIPRYDFFGAGITMVFAELSAVLSRYIFIRKNGYTYIQLFDKSTLKILFASLAMIIPIGYIKLNIHSVLLSFIISSLAGVITYVIILLLLKEELTIQYTKKIINKIKFF